MDIKKISDRLNTEISDSELEHFVQDNINFIGLNLSRFSKVFARSHGLRGNAYRKTA